MNVNSTSLSQQDVFEIIAKISGTSINEITLDSNINELCKNNNFKLGLVLYDIYEVLGMEIDFNEEETLYKFDTIENLLNHYHIN